MESNIGLVIKSLLFPALNISFHTERLARSLHVSRGNGADQQSIVVVVCQDNVRLIVSRKCQDNNGVNKTRKVELLSLNE